MDNCKNLFESILNGERVSLNHDNIKPQDRQKYNEIYKLYDKIYKKMHVKQQEKQLINSTERVSSYLVNSNHIPVKLTDRNTQYIDITITMKLFLVIY